MAMCVSRLRALLVGTLIVSLHSSVCTGGLFSVTAALAGHIGTDTVTAGFFSPDTLLCQFFTPVSAVDEAHTVTGSAPQTGCADSEFCLQNAARSAREDIPLLAADLLPVPIHVVTLPTGYLLPQDGPVSAVARDGPQFAHAQYLAHVLVKRE